MENKPEAKLVGIVVEGNKMGRKLGFPTINLKLSSPILDWKIGVYACFVYLEVDSDQISQLDLSSIITDKLPTSVELQNLNLTPLTKPYIGMAHYGPRSTFNDYQNNWEIHLLNFNADLYTQQVKVILRDYIRPSVKFESVEKLILQLKNDQLSVLKSLVKS